MYKIQQQVQGFLDSFKFLIKQKQAMTQIQATTVDKRLLLGKHHLQLVMNKKNN